MVQPYVPGSFPKLDDEDTRKVYVTDEYNKIALVSKSIVQDIGTAQAAITALQGDVADIQAILGSAPTVISSIGFQVLTTSQTYTRPSGLICAIVDCIGGGGGGGYGHGDISNFISQGGGGGAGGFSRKVVTAAAMGTSQLVTIAAGGTAGIFPNPAGDGGTTSFGSLCIANGGGHGVANSSGVVGVGGAGAAIGTGDLVVAGAHGGMGVYFNSTAGFGLVIPGGVGASSVLGGGGNLAAAWTSNNLAGSSGRSYGAGGGGGAGFGGSAPSGGAGFQGVCTIIEFLSA